MCRLWLIAFLTAGCFAARGAAADDQLNLVVEAHSSAMARMQSVYFKMTVNQDRPHLPPKFNCEYWRTGEAQAIHSFEAGIRIDTYLSPHRIVAVVRDRDRRTGSPAPVATVMANTPPVALSYSPWREALCGFNSDRGPGSLGLKEYVSSMKSPLLSRRGGFSVINSADGGSTIVIDPDANYMIRSIKSTFIVPYASGNSSTQTTSQEVTEFTEVIPGLFFPKKTTLIQIVDGKQVATSVAQFSDVKINSPIDPKTIEPQYPPNTLVSDRIKGLEYKVDESGRQIGQAVPLETRAAGIVTASTAQEYSTATLEEPRRDGWWLLPAGLATFCVVLAVMAIRYGRANRA